MFKSQKMTASNLLVILGVMLCILVVASTALAAGKCSSRSKLLKYTVEFKVSSTQYGPRVTDVQPITPKTVPIGYGFTVEEKLPQPTTKPPLYITEIDIRGPGLKLPLRIGLSWDGTSISSTGSKYAVYKNNHAEILDGVKLYKIYINGGHLSPPFKSFTPLGKHKVTWTICYDGPRATIVSDRKKTIKRPTPQNLKK